uniref:Exosome complex exonuclease RRP41 n=1 Tax=Cajanus cajan TaxID=3821 RepID=A0A151S949_CAJCA|nr:Exosome complex exonuclease RRP41 [Cajanus cajan]
MGNTKVITAVYSPREVQNRSQQISSHVLVRCDYSMANFSAGDCMRKLKGDRRSTEISLVIRQTMVACILTHLLPHSQIDIYVQVLQADGGTRSTCINAATLALPYARMPMHPLVTSCSVGYVNSTPLLEDSVGGLDVTLGILSKLDKVTLLQMDSKLPIDLLENVMQLAIEGCKAIVNYIREVRTIVNCDYNNKRSQNIVHTHFITKIPILLAGRFYWRTQINSSIDEVYSFVAKVLFLICFHLMLSICFLFYWKHLFWYTVLTKT